MTTATTDVASAEPTSASYEKLMGLVREASLLSSSASLLGWDQETHMPPGGLDHRSNQLAQLARMTHEMQTDPKIDDLLGECEADSQLMADPISIPAINVRELRHSYTRQTKLPASLVEAFAQTTSRSRAAWVDARKNSDFARFQPWLEKLVKLMQEQAACYGWADDGEPWDALAEDYEPGCTAKQVAEVFGPLREKLVGLIGSLNASASKPSDAFNQLKLPIEKQEAFVKYVAAEIGFDFNRGRLDISTHPFCSGTHCNDIRMTTRFQDHFLIDALGSTMHESGHGIYEQNLPGGTNIGTPFGSSVSLGIHESQSRMWENQVGRSQAFWKWCYPKLKEFFGNDVEGFSFDAVYGACNVVKPDFIRVEADEATYNLHIMVRFEIERAIMKGDLAVADVPDAWNQKYKDYLDLDVPDDARGCLQDIHWSLGSMGYFPTYTLGNLYCAQFFEQAMLDIPDLYSQFEQGEFGAVKDWLVKNILSQGKRYRAADLCKVVTGKPLSADPLLRHLQQKLNPLYGV
jgi:carboxypeptidase Taq